MSKYIYSFRFGSWTWFLFITLDSVIYTNEKSELTPAVEVALKLNSILFYFFLVCHYVQGYRIRQKVVTQPPINAYYLDSGINARLRYSITSGNEAGFFEMHDQTGELFLVREIDLETLPTAVLSLQIQVRNVVS